MHGITELEAIVTARRKSIGNWHPRAFSKLLCITISKCYERRRKGTVAGAYRELTTEKLNTMLAMIFLARCFERDPQENWLFLKPMPLPRPLENAV